MCTIGKGKPLEAREKHSIRQDSWFPAKAEATVNPPDPQDLKIRELEKTVGALEGRIDAMDRKKASPARSWADAGALPGGTDIDALRMGRAILVTECANCHRLFLPAEYSPEQWGGIVKRMANRASLGEDQAADLELYLAVSSRAGK